MLCCEGRQQLLHRKTGGSLTVPQRCHQRMFFFVGFFFVFALLSSPLMFRSEHIYDTLAQPLQSSAPSWPRGPCEKEEVEL